jgi:hypothetical protein
VLQGLILDEKITLIHKSVAICHSIIMLKLVKQKQEQGRSILDFSAELVASFIRFEMDINS